VLVVDDHPVLRDGIGLLLADVEDITVVGSLGSGKAALGYCERDAPDVVLMDLMMPDVDGVEAARIVRSRHPGTQVLVLTSFPDERLLRASLEAGACGYLLKSVGHAELVAAIRDAAHGRPTIDAEMLPMLVHQPPNQVGDDLTPRERDVLEALVRGLRNEEIAHELGIAPGTVRAYVSNLLAKLGVDNRTGAAVAAIQRGLVPESPPDR
jgi:DNA-binding NarL/FixJ family response regulator